jgi:large subunit ribosomal protein L7/L12
MSITQDQVVEYIKNLRLSDVKGLIEVLEQELGVEASAPIMMGGMAPAAGGAAEAAEEQTEFDVILTDFGDKKIGVIKVVRKITGLGLKDAKTLVEGVPAEIKAGIPKDEAEEIKKTIEEAGGKIEIK